MMCNAMTFDTLTKIMHTDKALVIFNEFTQTKNSFQSAFGNDIFEGLGGFLLWFFVVFLLDFFKHRLFNYQIVR